jgi:hypothetical protein
MRVYKDFVANLKAFTSLALDVGEWSASGFGKFTTGDGASRTASVGYCLDNTPDPGGYQVGWFSGSFLDLYLVRTCIEY